MYGRLLVKVETSVNLSDRFMEGTDEGGDKGTVLPPTPYFQSF